MSNDKHHHDYGPHVVTRLKRTWETKQITLRGLADQLVDHLAALVQIIWRVKADIAREQRRLNELRAEVNELRQIVQASRRQLDRRVTTLEEQ